MDITSVGTSIPRRSSAGVAPELERSYFQFPTYWQPDLRHFFAEGRAGTVHLEGHQICCTIVFLLIVMGEFLVYFLEVILRQAAWFGLFFIAVVIAI